MFIPPSVLMIVWGVFTEQSIGKLFSAGVIPGLMVTALFCVYIFAVALLRPSSWAALRQGQWQREAWVHPRDSRNHCKRRTRDRPVLVLG